MVVDYNVVPVNFPGQFIYNKYMAMHDLKIITQFEYNRPICLAWVYSENY